MSLRINFELSQSDLDHFYEAMQRSHESAEKIPEQQIIENSRQLLSQIRQSDAKDFVRDTVKQLDTLIGMLENRNWHLQDDDRERVLTALSYFSEAGDLIPDDIPGLGFLDDAIMIEIVCQQLQHEIQAYHEFVNDCAAKTGHTIEAKPCVEDIKWMEDRRTQLHARMRRRRKNHSNSNKTKSPFSLF